jgi:hypothetical protein
MVEDCSTQAQLEREGKRKSRQMRLHAYHRLLVPQAPGIVAAETELKLKP